MRPFTVRQEDTSQKTLALLSFGLPTVSFHPDLMMARRLNSLARCCVLVVSRLSNLTVKAERIVPYKDSQ